MSGACKSTSSKWRKVNVNPEIQVSFVKMKNYTGTEIRTHDLPTHLFLLQPSYPSFSKTFMLFQKMSWAEIVAPIGSNFYFLSQFQTNLILSLVFECEAWKESFFVILTFVATNKAAASVEVKPPRETLLEFPQIKFELIRSGRKSFSITFCFRRDLDRALSIFRFWVTSAAKQKSADFGPNSDR